MDKAVVVLGEASETDSEDDVQEKSNDFDVFSNVVQGILVTGEDTESDNESVASAISALEQLENTARVLKQPYNSLLHKKLSEDNASFRNNLNGFCSSLINDATNTLSGVEQQIVQSEVTLQNAITSVKNLSINSDALQNKLQSMMSDNFLSNVKVDK